MKQVIRFISLVAAMVLTLSCEHKELIYDVDWTVALTVNFDWTKAPEANPDGMSVYFFDLDNPGQRPERYDMIGRNGGRIKIVPGNYNCVCINNDVENILFQNDRSFEDYSIYTRKITMESGMNINTRFTVQTRGEEPADNNCIMSPDSCWTGILRNVEVKKGEVGRSITFVPEISVVTIDVRIINASNIQYSTEFGGTLDNMAGGFRMSDCSVIQQKTSYSFPLYSDGVSRLSTTFTVFGYDRAAMLPHTLKVYAKLPDGREWTKTFDVTDQILNAPDQKHIIITLSGLEVPKPIVNGSGFRPQVDDWLTKEIDVKM